MSQSNSELQTAYQQGVEPSVLLGRILLLMGVNRGEIMLGLQHNTTRLSHQRDVEHNRIMRILMITSIVAGIALILATTLTLARTILRPLERIIACFGKVIHDS